MTLTQISSHFFLEMAAILITCRVVGTLGQRWLRQPRVVGEMIAGVLLGPSVLGWFAPDLVAALFPPESKHVLYAGAQLGVGLYMFLVGLTFDRTEFRGAARSAAAVAAAGMAAPFAAGALMAPWLLGVPGLFAPGLGPARAALFLGAAIAITAFPMLARIIHERGIAGTRLGTLSLSSGAIGDAGAWLVIALVLASMGDRVVAIRALLGGGLFALAMLTIAPPLLKKLVAAIEARGGEEADAAGLAWVLVLFLLAAWAMDAAGIHAVFGGFLLGTAMPRGDFAERVRLRLEPFAVSFLLPQFFTFSGLNTRLQVVDNPSLLLVALAVLGASILAKGGASYLGARFAGEDHATALGIGALMNSRGLMELIIINIGLERGLIGPPLFAILVVMAIATTLMASPLFEWGYGRQMRARAAAGG